MKYQDVLQPLSGDGRPVAKGYCSLARLEDTGGGFLK